MLIRLAKPIRDPATQNEIVWDPVLSWITPETKDQAIFYIILYCIRNGIKKKSYLPVARLRELQIQLRWTGSQSSQKLGQRPQYP